MAGVRIAVAAAALATYGGGAEGHGFGQRFDLPLPLWLWVIGAAATILVSFVLMALFVAEPERRVRYPRVDLRRLRVGQWLTARWLLDVIRTVAVAVFLLAVFAALRGTQDPYRNLAPTVVWVIWWVGVAFLCALVGNLWRLLNPLRTLFVWAEALAATLGRRLALDLPYPRWLGTWPAVAVFVAFAWAELVWLGKDVPFDLGVLIIAYALWTWLGMFTYGRDVWLEHAEAFSVAFAVLGRFAPFAVRPSVEPSSRNIHSARWELDLRPPAVGLLDGAPEDWSRVVFIMTMLATVTFDGLIETPLWQDFSTALLAGSDAKAWLAAVAASAGLDDYQLLNTLALIAVSAIFIVIYATCCAAMRGIARNSSPVRVVACAFVPTLVPIAIAYHLAHYLSMLLTTGQFIIPLASDPLGRGWDLFGTAAYRPDLAFVGARLVWYVAVTAIVVGHVASVYLAHVVALRLFATRRAALRSQVPMVALMMLYTMTSLWILAQPIVG